MTLTCGPRAVVEGREREAERAGLPVWAGKVELGRLGRKKKKNRGGGKSGPAGLKRLGRKSKCFSFSEKGLNTINSNSNSRIQIQIEPRTKK